MKTVEEIFAAASSLGPAQLVKLRKKLDHLEQRIWDAELSVVSKNMKNAKITDKEIDRRIARRRRESRA